MQKNKPVVNPQTALLQYAFRLLARRDYSEREMRQKLGQKMKQIYKKIENTVLEKIIGRLLELNYLDDNKFTKQYLESKLAVSPQGRYLIRSKLVQKGIPENIFSKWWEEGKFNEQALAEKLLRQKRQLFSRLPEEKRKQKTTGLLASRGFSPDVIYGQLDRIE